MTNPNSDYRKYLLQVGLSYAIWGLLPIYFRLMKQATALEIMSNRILWSLAFLLIVLAARRQLGELVAILRQPKSVAALTVSALLIGLNWLGYVMAVNAHHVLAASLAYFLNPLLNVAISVILLGERVDRMQAAAFTLAALGVAVMAAGALTTLGISLFLALTFAFYGLARKLIVVSAMTGLAIETLLLTVPACISLFWVHGHGGMVFGSGIGITALLFSTGLVTSVPLILFVRGTRRLSLITMGLIQYVTPTLQFAAGVFLYHEPLSAAQWVSFALIWTGIAVFVAHALRRQREPAPAVA